MSKQAGKPLLMLLMLIAMQLIASLNMPSVYAATPTSTIEDVVAQTLNEQSSNGWDPKYNGVLINWRRDDPNKVNCSSSKCDARGSSTRHDAQNDLRYLENLYWYKSRHPGDASIDESIARVLPSVKKSWGTSTLDKGWVYYIFLRLARYSNEQAYWMQVAQNWAQAQASSVDPALGIHHGPITVSTDKNAAKLKDAYRVDHNIELGLALVDAGKRFNQPGWTTIGQREVDTVTRQSFSTTYHLFNRIYLISDPKAGSNKVYDFQAKMGEQGQIMEALIRTGIYTGNNDYLTVASQMLDALQSLPIHDTAQGGFFFKMYLGDYQGSKAGQVSTGSKEARQLHVLASVHLANAVLGNRWAALEEELLGLATTPDKLFTGTPAPGFHYQQLPSFAAYPCSGCTPQPTENWISSESDGIALEALQTVLSPVTKD